MRHLAKEAGRSLRFGIRLHVITRDTSEQAWAVAQQMLSELDPADVRKAQDALAASQSVGQQRMRALHGGATYTDAHELEVHPGLWAGVGLVRGGAGTALVGSHEEVAALIGEYAALGIDEFVLSGYPHVEEAYWFAEGVKPVLRAQGLLGPGREPSVAGRPRVAVVVGNPRPAAARSPPRPTWPASWWGRSGSPTSSSTSARSARGSWTRPPPSRSTGSSPRSGPRTSWSSRRRSTRRPTPGCSRCSSTGSRAAPV